MLDHRAVAETRPSAAGTLDGRRWPLVFAACAGLMGAAGVGIGAAAAHLGGSDLARTASEFLLIHAAAVVGASGVALALPRVSALLIAGLALLVVGAVLFGGELALAGLWELRPLPLAAPTGGLCLIAGWLALATASFSLARRWV